MFGQVDVFAPPLLTSEAPTASPSHVASLNPPPQRQVSQMFARFFSIPNESAHIIIGKLTSSEFLFNYL